jgi:hypothetical protein
MALTVVDEGRAHQLCASICVRSYGEKIAAEFVHLDGLEPSLREHGAHEGNYIAPWRTRQRLEPQRPFSVVQIELVRVIQGARHVRV